MQRLVQPVPVHLPPLRLRLNLHEFPEFGGAYPGGSTHSGPEALQPGLHGEAAVQQVELAVPVGSDHVMLL